MNDIASEVENLVHSIVWESERHRSAFGQLKTLQLLVESGGVTYSERFRSLVERYAEFDHDIVLSDEEATALKLMVDAEKLIAGSRQSSVSGELAVFELQTEERDLLLKRCEQMRKIVWSSTAFDGPHRTRLLRRISAMEIEIQKEKGLFDVILGGISDFGETSGKFGNDIKPLTDRMREVAQITRKQTPDYAELPAPEEVPQLTPPSSEQSDD